MGYNRRNKIIAIIRQLILLCVIFGVYSCRKFIEVDSPTTSINAQNVFENEATAASVLTGIYASLSTQNHSYNTDGFLTNLSLLGGLSADELILYDLNNTFLFPLYSNSLISSSNTGVWNNTYPIIFSANSAIIGLSSNSSTLNTTVKNHLVGEAKFIRAFCYFYLINLYGGVPLVLSPDPNKNLNLPRTSSDSIYNQIINDLTDAKNLLSTEYLASDAISKTTERVRPNQWAATALLAKVYLYMQNYKNAEEQASLLINNSSMFSLSSLDDVFLKNNFEAIWQLQPVDNPNEANTGEGQYLNLQPSGGPNAVNSVYISKFLLESFEKGDIRRKKWIDSINVDTTTYYYQFKYKVNANNTDQVVKEYLTLFRLGEQYLIRSEARVAQGNLTGAIDDLNVIRLRAGLTETTASNNTELTETILHERQVELFLENGNRWFDLKRMGKVDQIMTKVTPIKGGSWNINWQLYPIPMNERIANPNLTQNPGYN